LNLAIHGVHMVTDLKWMDQADCILLAIGIAALCLYWLRRHDDRVKPHPVGIYLFLIGSILGIIKLIQRNEITELVPFDGSPLFVWTIPNISWEDWLIGLWQGAIPQLPLTTLNSVVSVCALANSLYPMNTLTRRDVAFSVGVMNLCLCPFGAMPNCHGAGGLAGQHRFGARHGASVVFLGVNKMILALVFGSSALALMDALPDAILGVMLAIAGQELASTGLSSLSGQENFRMNTTVAMITTLMIVGVRKTHYGALAGWIAHVIFSIGQNREINGGQKSETTTKSMPVLDCESVEESTSFVVCDESNNRVLVRSKSL